MNAAIIKNYRDNENLRHSFNALAEKTFDGLSFEAWYQNGYWSDHYNPYSIVMDKRVIANVSVNLIDFICNGSRKHFIQLGTIMTEEHFRNRGLIRRLMDEIEKDYKAVADGMYLFANDSVLDFYPKFGFRKIMEYRYTKKFSTSQECSVVQLPMRDKKDWQRLESAMKDSVSYSRLHMIDNDYLILFYITGFMQENVYYDKKHDAYIIAEKTGSTLTVHNIFSKKKYPIDDILAAFGSGIGQITFGFTPEDVSNCTVSAFREDDCTLFAKGTAFDSFEQEQLIFPSLSHA